MTESLSNYSIVRPTPTKPKKKKKKEKENQISKVVTGRKIFYRNVDIGY